MDKSEIKALFVRYKNGQCTEEEIRLLQEWVMYSDFESDEISRAEMLKDLEAVESSLPLKRPKIRRLSLLRTIGYAASLVFILGIGYYYYQYRFSDTYSKEHQIELAALQPGSNKAVLQMENGTTIILDTLLQDELREIDGVMVQLNKDGQLVYLAQERSTTSKNNQIITPKGGQYALVLPDGTQVWLNAESKISFPNSFAHQTARSVTLEGEAYFKVTKDADHPFVVTVNEQRIEVLGTEFNVNAYAENTFIKTSLVKGSVLFGKHRLRPGESAVVEDNKTIVYKDNIDDIIAWKNGYFVFPEERLEVAMQKVARWYDLEVSFADEEARSILFGGSISRHENAQKIFDMIEKTADVKITVKHKKVTVHYDKKKG